MSLFSIQSTLPGTKKKINPIPAETRTKKDLFDDECDEALEKVGQRDNRCPIAGNIQDQAGWGSEQSDEVENISDH